MRRYNKWDRKIVNNMDGSSDTEICSTKLNDDTSKGRELVWGPEGVQAFASSIVVL
jgi:hypothetical protein